MSNIIPFNKDIPTFTELWQKYWSDEDKPESFTTLLSLDRVNCTVIKSYVDKRLTEALQTTYITPSPEKTIREASMLKLLDELGVNVPKITGFNKDKTAFSMIFIPGDPLMEWMDAHQLTDTEIEHVVKLLISVQTKLKSKKDVILNSFPPYPGHTGNVLLFLSETLKRIADKDWASSTDSLLKRKFIEIVDQLKNRIEAHSKYYQCNDVIYGDFVTRNIIRKPTGSLVLLDPILCIGRRSMDIARFGKSIVVRNIQLFNSKYEIILSTYNELSTHPVLREEVIDMLCIDLLRELSLYLNIPDSQLHRFPVFIKLASRDNLSLYLDKVIPNLFKDRVST